MENALIDALKAVRRIKNLFDQGYGIAEISFGDVYKKLESAKCFNLAVNMRCIENYSYYTFAEIKAKLNLIISDLEGKANAQKTHESNTTRNRALVGNASADKRIND